MYINYMIHERCDCMTDESTYVSSKRKRYNFTLLPEVKKEFKIACTRSELDMNEVLEILMQAYSDGVINLKELEE